MLIAERDEEGSLRRLHSELRLTRLGEGVDEAGRIAPAALTRSLDALAELVSVAERWRVARIECVGTSALRDAANRHELIGGAALLGLTVRTLSGDDEAALSAAAAISGLSLAPRVIVDIGGGSTEVISLGLRSQPLRRCSLNLGAVRLSERLRLDDPPRAAQLVSLRQTIQAELDSGLSAGDLPPAEELIAVAGTAVSLLMIHLELRAYDPLLLSHGVLSLAALQAITDELWSLTAAERVLRFGLPPKRADVLPVGAELLIALSRRFEKNRVTVRDRGISWGLAASLI